MKPMRTLVILLAVLACRPSDASDIVVFGRLVSNEPMDYVKDECPKDHICLRSWWKSVVQIQKTIQGKVLPDRVTTANMQHTSWDPKVRKALRLFVLEPIDDPDQRAKLRADYYLKDMSALHQMFCLSQDPKTLGLNAEESYVTGAGEDKTYCFELH